MSYLLNPIQMALGVSAGDLVGRNTVRISINGTVYDMQIPDPVGDYLWADRGTGTDSLLIALVTTLNLAEFAEGSGGLWTVEWDYGALGYYRFVRSIGQDGDDIQIQWNDDATTAVAQWWGFPAEKITMSNGQIASSFQCGLLWLPENFAVRWESRRVQESQSLINPFTGAVARWSHGGYTAWRIRLEQIAQLFTFTERSARGEVALCARPGVALGDPNVSFEGGIWRWLGDLGDSSMRLWRDREDLSEYIEASPYSTEGLGDLARVFEEQSIASQRFAFDMEFAQEGDE